MQNPLLNSAEFGKLYFFAPVFLLSPLWCLKGLWYFVTTPHLPASRIFTQNADLFLFFPLLSWSGGSNSRSSGGKTKTWWRHLGGTFKNAAGLKVLKISLCCRDLAHGPQTLLSPLLPGHRPRTLALLRSHCCCLLNIRHSHWPSEPSGGAPLVSTRFN